MARHWQDAHAQRFQPRKLNGPAGFFHHHAVARAQQGAADDIQRMGSANAGDDLPGRGLHAEAAQLFGQGTAQTAVAGGLAVLQREVMQGPPAGELAHGSRHETGFEPIRRKHAHTRLELFAAAVKHAAYQRGGVDRRVTGLKTPAGLASSGRMHRL